MNNVNKLARLIKDAKIVKINGYLVNVYTNDVDRWQKNDMREDTCYLDGIITYENALVTDNNLQLAKEMIEIIKAVNLRPARFKIENGVITSVSFA